VPWIITQDCLRDCRGRNVWRPTSLRRKATEYAANERHRLRMAKIENMAWDVPGCLMDGFTISHCLWCPRNGSRRRSRNRADCP